MNDETRGTEERIDGRHFDLQTTVCPNGVVNVRNPDSGSGDVHTVHLTDAGTVERCTCKGFTHHGHCYHSDAIASNGRLRAAARACADRQTIATDGGHDEPDDDTNPIDDVLPDEWIVDAPNPTEREARSNDLEPEPGAEVIGSEAPDMGRGPSGVDDL